MNRQYYVYIPTNKRHSVLYTGVTGDLPKRVYEHKNKLTPGFTGKYNVDELVYYEITEDSYSALTREKQIKAGSRQSKLDLIKAMNPTWRDLADGI